MPDALFLPFEAHRRCPDDPRFPDGHRPLADIEAATVTGHPELFPDQTSVATFVAEVVARHGRIAEA